MIIANVAKRILRPFANVGARADIPINQADATRASYEQGFPALNMTPIAAGGVPPSGQDFNGILYDVSNAALWQQATGILPWSAEFAQSAVSGGYPKNALVIHNAMLYQSSVDNNTSTPGNGTDWQGVGVASATQPQHAVTQKQLQDRLAQHSGQVAFFASANAPDGWLAANGAAVSRTAYANLFVVIGTTFGAGDGSTTFNLPDLRGEFLRGWDAGRGLDANRALGSKQKGTIYGYDTNGDGVWNISATSRVGLTSQEQIGVDSYSASDYSTALLTGANNAVRSDLPGVAGNQAYSGVMRPRNVALLACIKY